jgi:hypothetical protein
VFSGDGVEAGLRQVGGVLLRQVGTLPDRKRPGIRIYFSNFCPFLFIHFSNFIYPFFTILFNQFYLSNSIFQILFIHFCPILFFHFLSNFIYPFLSNLSNFGQKSF